MSDDPATALRTAITNDDIASLSVLLESQSGAEMLLNDGLFNWGMPPLAAARSREAADLLLKHGASLESVSKWWGPGFGASQVLPDTAEHLIGLGASISPHAAAAIGLEKQLADLLADDPNLVNAQGGDGCHPLHFATTIDIATLLVEHGADLDARDEDHDSTPAQWRIKEAPEMVRFLLSKGATADIFLAAALGDSELAAQLIAGDPACTTHRIGYNSGPYPGIGHEGRGGTIYQWTLGFNLSPHEVALKYGHQELYDQLLENTPPRHQLLVACTSANRQLAESIEREHPNLVEELDAEDRTLLAKYCWETNIDLEAVRLMLELGFPVDVPEGNHGFMALHNAAWCGNPELVKLLLDHGHPLDRRDPEYKATALGFALHSYLEAKRHPDGKFLEVVKLLADAGVPIDEPQRNCGDAAIEALLKAK